MGRRSSGLTERIARNQARGAARVDPLIDGDPLVSEASREGHLCTPVASARLFFFSIAKLPENAMANLGRARGWMVENGGGERWGLGLGKEPKASMTPLPPTLLSRCHCEETPQLGPRRRYQWWRRGGEPLQCGS